MTDLEKLRTDLDTATPHQTPPWADGIPPADLKRLLQRAEQIRRDTQIIRAYMRHDK